MDVGGRQWLRDLATGSRCSSRTRSAAAQGSATPRKRWSEGSPRASARGPGDSRPRTAARGCVAMRELSGQGDTGGLGADRAAPLANADELARFFVASRGETRATFVHEVA